MVEDWVIEPGSGRWERRSVRSRAELDALVEQFRPRILKPTEAEVQRALKRLEEDGKYDPATGEFEWDKPTPCRICGRSDGQHDPTKAERRAIRRLKWRAFWRGFCDPFGVFHVG